MAEELDRREMLEAALEQAEEGTLEAPIEKEIEVNDDPIQTENASEEASTEESNNRDEKGRFKSKSEEASSQDDTAEEPELVAEDTNDVQDVEPTRPTTWKKEYVEVWEKMKDGQQLSKEEFVKFAEYANQREAEYKRGVSAYKAEADNARSLTEAIGPFVPELQAQNIHPAAWINNLGRAHMILSKAPYEQKVQMFHRLAQDYGIQLNQDGIQMPEQQYVDPYQQQLMQQLQATQQQVQQLSAIRDQEENARLTQEINRVSSDKGRFGLDRHLLQSPFRLVLLMCLLRLAPLRLQAFLCGLVLHSCNAPYLSFAYASSAICRLRDSFSALLNSCFFCSIGTSLPISM